MSTGDHFGMFSVAPQMCRLFGPFGSAVGQHVSAATNVAVNPNKGDDFAGRLAHCYAKTQKGEKGGDGGAKNGEDKMKRGGQRLLCVKQKTGRMDRSYWRDGEYRRLPERPLRGAPNRDFAPPPLASRDINRPLFHQSR